MLRRTLLTLSLLMLGPMACAQTSNEPYQEGVHYTAFAQPVRVQNPNKINVTEVFWYGCSHCFTFEPMVQAWSAKLPNDVVFHHSPAMWNGVMRLHAQTYYTAKALKALDQVHQPIFNALNLERKRLASQGEIEQLFVKQGIDAEKFEKAWGSFGVRSQVQQADARARAYKISGTPEVIVNGRYRITTAMAKGQANMLKVAEFLIEKERQRLSGSKN